jgi:transcriptional regulator with XRE-family HTH domain
MGEQLEALEPRPWDRTLTLNGRRLRRARIRAGMSQDALGAAVKVSQQLISSYERELVVAPTDGVIRALADVLGVDVSTLCRADRRRAS